MRSAVVVGAGVGGLAAAGALARTGWQVTLLERGDRLRGDSAALLLWPNGVRALRALGLGGGLGAIASPAPTRGIRRPGGQWLVEPDPAEARGDGLLPVCAAGGPGLGGRCERGRDLLARDGTGGLRARAGGHPAEPAAPVVHRLARADRRPAGRDRARRPDPAHRRRAAADATGVRV